MPTTLSPYTSGLDGIPANHVPLTPLTFIERAAAVYPRDRRGARRLRRSWAEIYARCRRLASALARHGIGTGDTVAVMLPNTPPMVEAHFGIPMAGAVLNALNTRLDPETVAFMLDHGEAKAVIVDRSSRRVMARRWRSAGAQPLLVIDVEDASTPGRRERDRQHRLRRVPGGGRPEFAWRCRADEWDAIALNYTSGTTGNPKGVVYHHRGAHLNAISNILEWDMPKHPVYLWTLPMFHCNGWCFPWTVAARAGRQRLPAQGRRRAMVDAIREHGVTHYCGAPIVQQHAGERAGRDEAGPAARRQGDGRGRRAAGVDDRGHGAAGLRPHPRLRPDRGLRPGDGLPQARRMGRAATSASGRG